MSWHTVPAAFVALTATQVVVYGVAFFGGIYALFGSVTWLLTRHILPALKLGLMLDPRPVSAAQLRREWLWSAVSVAIFGIGMLIPWGLLQIGWARFYPDASVGINAPRILLEVAALMVWNDVHFWLNHRLLHTRALIRFHRLHHRSVVTTPFATYAFHPVEAAMLGSVMVPPMLVHDFSFWSLLALPILSLWINCTGHANYDFCPGIPRVVPLTHWLTGSHQHHLHHACARGNYGFQFDFMDRLFGTRLPENAAQPQIDRYLATHPSTIQGRQ